MNEQSLIAKTFFQYAYIYILFYVHILYKLYINVTWGVDSWFRYDETASPALL